MSSDREGKGKDLNFAQNSPKGADDAREQCPRTRFFGGTTAGSRSGPKKRDSPSNESLGKPEVPPGFRWDTEDDDCRSPFRRTGETTIDATARAQPTTPTVREYGTSFRGDGRHKGTGNVSSNAIRGQGNGSTEKPEVTTKKDVLTETAPESSTRSSSASEQVHNTSKSAAAPTLRASSPLHEAPSDMEKLVQTTACYSVYQYIDFIKSQSLNSSRASLSKRGDSPGLTDEMPRYQDTSTIRSKDMAVQKSLLAVSPPHDRETALPIHESTRKSPMGWSPCDGDVALPGINAFGQLTPESDHLSNTPCTDMSLTGFLPDNKTRSRYSQPETPVALRRIEKIKSMSAIKAEKQGVKQPHVPQLLTPDSTAFIRYQSSLSAFPSTPSPKIRARVRNPFSDADSPCTYHSVPRLTDPFTSTPDSPWRTSHIKEEGTLAGSSPLIKNEADADDDSHSGITLPVPWADRNRRSQSTALIHEPLPGSLDVIWKWSFTSNRKKMLPPFLWTVQTMCKDLTTKEIPKGHIYAFSVDDPRKHNYIKIGVSTNLKKRGQAHKTCYGEMRQVYPLKGKKPITVDHALRVEHLVHAELVQYALEIEKCPDHRGSHKAHREWYDVGESHAVAVIEKWSQWMSSTPYEEGPLTEISKEKTPTRRRASGNSVKAKSPKSGSPSPRGKTFKSKAPELPTTRWHLTTIGPDEMLGFCWPMDMWGNALGETALVKYEPSGAASAELIQQPG
jgi:T5orf172 domain